MATLSACSGGLSLLPQPVAPTLSVVTMAGGAPGSAGISGVVSDATWVSLFETLDRAVIHQHHYRSVFGSYAANWKMLGLALPEALNDAFELALVLPNGESGDRFTFTARPKCHGCSSRADVIAVDQSFAVQSFVPIPPPRRDYIVARAKRFLEALENQSSLVRFSERGVFNEYFSYALTHASSGERAWTAHGLRHPVQGVVLMSGEVREAGSKAGFKNSKSLSASVENLPWFGPLLEPPRSLGGAPSETALEGGPLASSNLSLLSPLAVRPLNELAQALGGLLSPEKNSIAASALPTHTARGERHLASPPLTTPIQKKPIQKSDGLVIEPIGDSR